jgi:methylamine dehydrogenase accessory protein MauD
MKRILMAAKAQHYLLFDASCSLCSDLAGDVERASDHKLVTKSLYDRDALELLKRARPNYKFEPTLLQVKGDKVRAFTGIMMRAQMVTFLNPLQLLKIARIVQKAGVPLFGEFEAHEAPEEIQESSARDHAAEPAPRDFGPGFRFSAVGPELGTRTPISELTTMRGEMLDLTFDAERNTLLLFLSTHCPFCVIVAQALAEFAADAPERVVVVFGTADPDKLREFLQTHRLENLPIVLSPETRAAFGVTGVPYGFAIDQRGIIRGKGVVNNNDHLDSLANTFYVSVEAFKQALASRSEEKVVVS